MEIKIFKIGDCDWIAAKTIDEAKECHREMMGYGSREEYGEFFDEQDWHELSDSSLDQLIYVEEDEPEIERTFRQELQRMIDTGEVFPALFASTEY